MASRVIHLAITERIAKRCGCRDKNRLQFGSILPDAATGGNSHMRIVICNGTKKTYDLTGFRARFLPLMLADDLYLGYYLHLVQDLYFRDYVYHRHHWDPRPAGNVERLHNDYALINSYVVETYALANTVTAPAAFAAEPLNRLGSFAVEEFLALLQGDFQSRLAGKAFFFTREMADEFIALAGEKCAQEADALRRGGSVVDEMALAYAKK